MRGCRIPIRHASPSGRGPTIAMSPPRFTSPLAHAGVAAQRRGAVRRVLLHDAAEIELHAGHRKLERGGAQRSLSQPTRRAARRSRRIGKRARLEAPGAAQDPGRDVEQPVALAMAGRRVVEQARGLGVDLDRSARCRDAIDLRQQARVAIARIARLEPLDLARRRDDRALRVGLPRAKSWISQGEPIALKRGGRAFRARSAVRGCGPQNVVLHVADSVPRRSS